MAEDLVEAGSVLGFISTKETPPVDSSALKIDVVWKIHVPGLKAEKARVVSIPADIIVVSIEIQYSKSDASISHGLVKGLYANSPFHIIVSYYELAEDFKVALNKTKSNGLIILDGDHFQDLQSWTTYMLSHRNNTNKGSLTSQKVYKAIMDNPDNMEQKIRETIEDDVKLMFTPMKIQELYQAISFSMGDDYVLSKAIGSAIKFTRDLVKKYNLSKTLSLPHNALFVYPQTTNYIVRWSDADIIITSEGLFLGERGFDTKYPLTFEGRNVYVKGSDGKVRLWESLPTDRVKSFIRMIMEAARNYIASFMINSEDSKELEQTIRTIEKLNKDLNESLDDR